MSETAQEKQHGRSKSAAGPGFVGKKTKTVPYPITIGEADPDGRSLHLKYAPTVIIDPKSSKKFLWKNEFNLISPSELPKFRLFRTNKTDLNELAHSCTRYNLDEFLSILTFAQRNKDEDSYLWQRLQRKGDYLVAFSKGDFIYKAFIGQVQELHIVIHDVGHMNYLSAFDYVLSNADSPMGIEKSIQNQKQGFEKFQDFAKKIAKEVREKFSLLSLN